MGSVGSCWTLCSILLLLGGNLGVLIEILQDSVNGTVGQSVLLPVSYKFMNSSRFPVAFEWKFSNKISLIACTVQNCSLSAEGAPKNCSENHFTHAAYQGRAVLFAENASLLLRDLQLGDSGVYSITFKQQVQTRQINLTVYRRHFTSEDGNTSVQDLTAVTACIVGGCLVLFLLLFLLSCNRRFGAILPKTSRVIRQQESPSHDESHMENKLRRDISTVYALIGGDQTQPRVMPKAECMSVAVSTQEHCLT